MPPLEQVIRFEGEGRERRETTQDTRRQQRVQMGQLFLPDEDDQRAHQKRAEDVDEQHAKRNRQGRSDQAQDCNAR